MEGTKVQSAESCRARPGGRAGDTVFCAEMGEFYGHGVKLDSLALFDEKGICIRPSRAFFLMIASFAVAP